jgi:hypothetical protein
MRRRRHQRLATPGQAPRDEGISSGNEIDADDRFEAALRLAEVDPAQADNACVASRPATSSTRHQPRNVGRTSRSRSSPGRRDRGGARKRAKDRSDSSRAALPRAVTRNCPAESTPTPERSGAAAVTQRCQQRAEVIDLGIGAWPKNSGTERDSGNSGSTYDDAELAALVVLPHRGRGWPTCRSARYCRTSSYGLGHRYGRPA